MRKVLATHGRRTGAFVTVVAVSVAYAAMYGTVTPPTIDVSQYGNALFSGWASALASVWPYAAAATVAAATLGLIAMFIGRHRLPGIGGRRR